ncbi:hypothetical protein UlMin_008064 [Ulmus minor]
MKGNEITLSEDEPANHEELVIAELPKAKGWLGSLSFYQGFWCPSHLVPNVISFQTHFKALDQDIIIASKPKSGTTWLKALLFSIMNRSLYTCSNTPLLTSNPHQLVPFLEFTLYNKKKHVDLSGIPSPRLFSTHIPYPSLPESIKHLSKCRIVYICRNPLDVVVSFWHFATRDHPERQSRWSLDEYLESFCKGEEGFGPFWEHALGFWKESLERPEKVLFLNYEDLKNDTAFHVKRLAEFVGFGFSEEEERKGAVDEISNLCSLSTLKDLEVNKSGNFMPNFKNKSYFRKGEVGDWVNLLTPSMVERIQKVIEEKTTASGFTFKMSSI